MLNKKQINILSGKEIRIKRLQNDIKSDDLAKILNITKSYLLRLETGHENARNIRAVATLYFNQLEEKE